MNVICIITSRYSLQLSLLLGDLLSVEPSTRPSVQSCLSKEVILSHMRTYRDRCLQTELDVCSDVVRDDMQKPVVNIPRTVLERMQQLAIDQKDQKLSPIRHVEVKRVAKVESEKDRELLVRFESEIKVKNEFLRSRNTAADDVDLELTTNQNARVAMMMPRIPAAVAPKCDEQQDSDDVPVDVEDGEADDDDVGSRDSECDEAEQKNNMLLTMTKVLYLIIVLS